MEWKDRLLFAYDLQWFAKDGPGGEKTEPATEKKLREAREDGKVAKRTIETGIASDSYIEVKSGLKKGDVVITDSPDTLTEGLPVETKEASGQTDGEAQQDTVVAE